MSIEDKAEIERRWNKLSAILERYRLSRYEAKIIGEMLVAFFELEGTLDDCLARWFLPLKSGPAECLRDQILMFTTLNHKLTMASENKILDPFGCGCLELGDEGS